MNELHNAQNVILCQIIESPFEVMYKKHFFNPRKCNSASTLSDCIQRNVSKIIIALPTSNFIVEVFEKTVPEGFNGVNTRLVFESEILLPNYTHSQYNKMSIDLKFHYQIKLDAEKDYQYSRITSKILELQENNCCC